MKVIHKIIAVGTLVAIAYLATLSIESIRDSFLSVALITIAMMLIIFWFINHIINKRINLLNQFIKKIEEDDSADHTIDLKSKDEIAMLSANINQFVKKINLHKKKIEIALQQKNLELRQEIAKRKQVERKLLHKKDYLKEVAKYDQVTTLPNHVFFNEMLNKAINHAKRHNELLAILLINLDSFTHIKNKIGVDHAELVLREIAKRFKNLLRKEDVIAKLHGDEFIVLLSDIKKHKFAGTVAEKLLSICSQLLKIDAYEFSITASIGISIYPNDGDSLETLMESAEKSLFTAKQHGGHNYQFHTEEMDTEAREYLQLGSALRQAIHNNELILYYQPKFRLKKGNISGVEALLRWEHPTLGIISPAKFIPLAEDSGLIMQIGEWALREACRMIKYWHDEGYEHMTVSLKLSHKQFHHPDIIATIAKVLKTTGLNPKYLELEITEQSVMDNLDGAFEILTKMKELGIQISIDHFGTGYTSIRYLKLFPLNAIKIDQSFIKGLPHHPNDCAITSAFIALAHHLGLEVVAEGVETAEQIQFLTKEHCDIVQGYFLGHPLPASNIVHQFKKLAEKALV